MRKYLNFYDSLNLAEMELSQNMTTFRSKYDPLIRDSAAAIFKRLGYTRFYNLTHSFSQSKVALAMYVGNGLVAKIIPQSELSTENMIYHLPAIHSEQFSGEYDTFSIKFYPWLSKDLNQPNDVEKMRNTMASLNISFIEGDDALRNIRHIPDQNATLVGIDSNMFIFNKQAKPIDSKLLSAWHKYVHSVFPIYDDAALPRQDVGENVVFTTLFNRDTNIIGFDHTQKDPILRTPKDEAKPRRNFFHFLGLG